MIARRIMQQSGYINSTSAEFMSQPLLDMIITCLVTIYFVLWLYDYNNNNKSKKKKWQISEGKMGVK